MHLSAGEERLSSTFDWDRKMQLSFFAQSGIYMTSIIHKKGNKNRSSKASSASVFAADVSPSGGAVMPFDKTNAGFCAAPRLKDSRTDGRIIPNYPNAPRRRSKTSFQDI
ncbi:hypothetical protein CDAR_174201 [Caerostris darwini]|uniref:Uncharacterized protein n=1 Tax=Caerostris darwini TaxID=1538125 RepID=A0AAV4VHN7_9ARAC|nr:hypothetical protein CDAR_174201 [Caerostris darwini]